MERLVISTLTFCREIDFKQDLSDLKGLVFLLIIVNIQPVYGNKKDSEYLRRKVKGRNMQRYIRRNSTIKANAPIVKLMNLIWGL